MLPMEGASGIVFQSIQAVPPYERAIAASAHVRAFIDSLVEWAPGLHHPSGPARARPRSEDRAQRETSG